MQRIHGLVIRANVALPGIAPADAPSADVVLDLAERLADPVPTRIRYRSGGANDVTARVEIAEDARGGTTFRYGDGTAVDVDLRSHPARIRASILTALPRRQNMITTRGGCSLALTASSTKTSLAP